MSHKQQDVSTDGMLLAAMRVMCTYCSCACYNWP